jgi:hypothetical protein
VAQHVAGDLLGAAGVLGGDRVDVGKRVTGDEDDRFRAVQGCHGVVRDGRGTQHGEPVDAGGQLAHGTDEVDLALRQHEHHALAELGRP